MENGSITSWYRILIIEVFRLAAQSVSVEIFRMFLDVVVLLEKQNFLNVGSYDFMLLYCL